MFKSVNRKVSIQYVINENLLWEVDKFIGENEGLVIAEIELENEKQSNNFTGMG